MTGSTHPLRSGFSLAFAAAGLLLGACKQPLELPDPKPRVVHAAAPGAIPNSAPAPAAARRTFGRNAPTPVQIDTALRAGRDAAQSCIALIDRDADGFFRCVRFKAQPATAVSVLDDVRRLGAYWFGWATADVHGAYAVDGSDRAARTLLADAVSLQSALDLGDDRLCGLVAAPCEQVTSRKRDLLGGNIEVPLHY